MVFPEKDANKKNCHYEKKTNVRSCADAPAQILNTPNLLGTSLNNAEPVPRPKLC